MESIYTRYRKLKKEIRDVAAVDLQRLSRGYLSRMKPNCCTNSWNKKVVAAVALANAAAASENNGSKTVATAALRKQQSFNTSGSGGVISVNVSPKRIRGLDNNSAVGSNNTTTTATVVAAAASVTATHSPPSSNNSSITTTSNSMSAAGFHPGSNIPTALYASYRTLLDQKRDLKRRLKKFDEDFLERYGRNPKKSDKEVIRPMYQNYHEVSIVAW